MNLKFWEKIYYAQSFKEHFNAPPSVKRKRKRLCDIIYKPWPVPLCKCHDCRSARKPPKRIQLQKFYHRNYCYGYRTPKDLQIEHLTYIKFYEMFVDNCPYRSDVFNIIYKYDTKWEWININYEIVALIHNPVQELINELQQFIDHINQTDFYSKYRLEWSVSKWTKDDPNEYALTLVQT